MQGKTHFRIGLASGVGAAYVSGYETDLVSLSLSVAIAGLASLLPDIDEDGSYVNKLLFSYLDRKYRSLALAVLGAVVIILFYVWSFPWWVLLSGIYAVGVAYIPHRSLTHSLLGMGYVSFIVYLAIPEYFWVFLLGYLSHLIADAFTVAGIPIFWPYRKRFGLKNFGLRIRSGKLIDIYMGRVTLILFCMGYVYFIGRMIWIS